MPEQKGSPGLFAIYHFWRPLGLGTAYVFYILNPQLPVRLAQQYRMIYLFLLNKWYFDELYDHMVVRPAMAIGEGLWKGGDQTADRRARPERCGRR